MKKLAWSLVLCISILGTGCQDLKQGVIHFYAGEYAWALQYLTKIAEKSAKTPPHVTLSLHKTTLEEALPHATEDYFRGWMAYAGSHIGLNHHDQGCEAIKTAMRPIRVKICGKKGTQMVDPAQGDFWQAEVFVLRAWWINLPCDNKSELEPQLLD